MPNVAGIDRRMLNAAATGTSTYRHRDNSVHPTLTNHYIQWATGVTAGVVKIEAAYDTASSTYAGTWTVLATVTNDGSGNAYQDLVQVPGPFKSIRHRISTTVSGGGSPSVTTYIVAENN